MPVSSIIVTTKAVGWIFAHARSHPRTERQFTTSQEFLAALFPVRRPLEMFRPDEAPSHRIKVARCCKPCIECRWSQPSDAEWAQRSRRPFMGSIRWASDLDATAIRILIHPRFRFTM